MFCWECGTEVEDNSAFCPHCGTHLILPKVDDSASESATQLTVDDEPESEAQPIDNSKSDETEQARPAPKRKRTSLIIGIVVLVVVVCGAVGIGLWWKADQDAKAAAAAAQAEWERTHVTLVTQLDVEAPGFDMAATGIPVQVTGTDLDGGSVSEIQYLHLDNMTISTLPGTYEATFPGGYFTDDGTVVKAPSTSLTVEVPVPAASSTDATPSGSASSASSQPAESSSNAASPGSEGANTESANTGKTEDSLVTGEKPVFVAADPLEVDDQLLSEIGNLAAADPQDGGKAGTLQKAATEKRDAAVAEKERQEREAAERAEAMARIDGWWYQPSMGGIYYFHFHDGIAEGFANERNGARRLNTKTIGSIERVSAADGFPSDGWYYPFTDAPGYYLADNDQSTLVDMARYSDSFTRANPPASILAIAG